MLSGKRFGQGLLSSLFVFCITTVAVLTAINVVFGSPDPLKKALLDGQVYDAAATGLIDQATKDAQKKQGDNASDPRGHHDDIDLSNPVIQNAAKQVVTPTRLQGYAEQAIDGTYRWLDGTTQTPDFALDLASLKQDLGASVSNATVQHVQSLPACTPAQLQQLNTTHIDPFNLPCRPPGLNLETERQKIVADINNSDALKDTTVTAQDLNSEKPGQDPFQQLKAIPVIFQWSKVAPWILGALGLAAGAGLIFLRHDRRRGIKSVAMSLLITGGVLLVIIVLTTIAFGKFHPEAVGENAQLQTAVLAVIKTLDGSLNRILVIFAVVYALLGVGGLIYLHMTKPKAAPESEASLPTPKVDDTPKPRKPMSAK